MKQVSYDDLARLPVLLSYEVSFRKVTGVPLRLIPPDEPAHLLSLRIFAEAFRAKPGNAPAGGRSPSTGNLAAPHVYRFAGLILAVAPVVVGGRHVATLATESVCYRKPTQSDFRRAVKMLQRGSSAAWEKMARAAYFETPVITNDRFDAITHLLTVFAEYLSDYASRHSIACSDDEPCAVTNAKRFVLSRFGTSIALGEVVDHVRMSRFYFCKLFKKSTGMTLTEYISRVRMEKARTLLADPSMRISEVVFAAGFGSVAQFNSVFKRLIGTTPTNYRSTLRARPAAATAN